MSLYTYFPSCKKNLPLNLTMTHSEKQSVENVHSETLFNCNFCDKSFQAMGEFMKHKKQEHAAKIRPCRSFKNGECSFGDQKITEKVSNLEKQK